MAERAPSNMADAIVGIYIALSTAMGEEQCAFADDLIKDFAAMTPPGVGKIFLEHLARVLDEDRAPSQGPRLVVDNEKPNG